MTRSQKSVVFTFTVLMALYWGTIALAIVLSFFFPLKAHAAPMHELTAAGTVVNPLEETRYCGTPQRDGHGQIIRDQKPLIAFQSWHPCPANGKRQGACPGYVIDHVIPLACGGCDAVSNMQWQSIAEGKDKDQVERKWYGTDPAIPGTTCDVPRAQK